MIYLYMYLQGGVSDAYHVGQIDNDRIIISTTVTHQHETLMEARLASGCLLEEPSAGCLRELATSCTEGGQLGGWTNSQEPRRPAEELQMMTANLSNEINDKHLVILDVLGRGGFATVRHYQFVTPQKDNNCEPPINHLPLTRS